VAVPETLLDRWRLRRYERRERREARQYQEQFCRPLSPELKRRLRVMRLAEHNRVEGWCPVCHRGDVVLSPYVDALGAPVFGCANEAACLAACGTRTATDPQWRDVNA
jgi:hypothetical protein